MRDLKRQIQHEKSKFAKNKLSRTAMGYDLKVGEQMKETQELRNMVKQLEKQETLIINRLNQTIQKEHMTMQQLERTTEMSPFGMKFYKKPDFHNLGLRNEN